MNPKNIKKHGIYLTKYFQLIIEINLKLFLYIKLFFLKCFTFVSLNIKLTGKFIIKSDYVHLYMYQKRLHVLIFIPFTLSQY